MDEAVKGARLCLGLCLLLGASQPACAQALQDPTRPPAALMAGQGAVQAAPAAQRPPQLQSVLIARQPGGRHVAVIDGETLRLGDSYKGARLTRIEQNQVELVRGRTRQVLTLQPAAPEAGAIERIKGKHDK
jgi:MSHA biogenesis protein MshK